MPPRGSMNTCRRESFSTAPGLVESILEFAVASVAGFEAGVAGALLGSEPTGVAGLVWANAMFDRTVTANNVVKKNFIIHFLQTVCQLPAAQTTTAAART